MADFKYEGLDQTGRRVLGEIEAKDQQDAKRLLRRKGIRARKLTKPNKLSEVDLFEMWSEFKSVGGGYSDKDIGRFTKQLATLVNAGVPILQSLDILRKQEKKAPLKKALTRISRGVSEGMTLNEAMGKEPGFPKLYCQLIKAGEMAGILDDILKKLDLFIERRIALKAQIKSAMMYPAIVLTIGVIVIIGLMTFVVPTFVGMLEESGNEIPWITQFVINISEFFQNHIFKIIGLCLITGFGIHHCINKTDRGKKIFDKLILKMPVIGNVVIKGSLSSFSQTLATMLGAGISIVDALEVCADTIDNTVIAKDIKRVRASVVSGRNIAEPLSRIKYFPDLITQMINVGESTGNLDEMLKKVSKVFEVEVEGSIQTMTQMLEPLLIVGLAIMVGGVLLAMYMPMFVQAGGA